MEIRSITPCKSGPDIQHVIAQLDNEIDISKACEALKTEEGNLIKFLRCSEELGAIRFTSGAMMILVYKSGKITVRHAASEEIAKGLLEKIAELVE
ncbi:hypothetical protein J7W08_02445 [Methanococcoides orientis]|uniref:hypothetical protein n=1 Tax=Methanococcoides orientis TaxID=2822137 RepID=UPI001E60668B|nr:hypothetical protein [Methanococcoides orientis]UGV41184.1 hypothetical protein J7W08_02445 [Methanococcoides orientis]